VVIIGQKEEKTKGKEAVTIMNVLRDGQGILMPC
jgi:hypothetical protein